MRKSIRMGKTKKMNCINNFRAVSLGTVFECVSESLRKPPLFQFWSQITWPAPFSPRVPDWTRNDSGFFSEHLLSKTRELLLSRWSLVCCGFASSPQRGIFSLFCL